MKKIHSVPRSNMVPQLPKLFRALGDREPRSSKDVASVCSWSLEPYLVHVAMDVSFGSFPSGKISYAWNGIEKFEHTHTHEITVPAPIGDWMEGSLFTRPTELNRRVTKCKYVVADDDETCHLIIDPPANGSRILASHGELMKSKYMQRVMLGCQENDSSCMSISC